MRRDSRSPCHGGAGRQAPRPPPARPLRHLPPPKPSPPAPAATATALLLLVLATAARPCSSALSGKKGATVKATILPGSGGGGGGGGSLLPDALDERVLEARKVLFSDDCQLFKGGSTVVRITDPTQGVFTGGDFGLSPWSADGRYFIASRASTFNRSLTANDTLEVGVIDFEAACKTGRAKWTPLPQAKTRAWNLQQGSMVQWLGNSSRIVFNSRGCGYGPTIGADKTGATDHFCSVVYDVAAKKRVVELPLPINSVDFFGRYALSIDQAGLYRVQKGYAYVPSTPLPAGSLLPCATHDTGVYLLDLAKSGAPPKLIISLRQAWEAVQTAGSTDQVTGQPFNANEPFAKSGTEARSWLSSCNHWFNAPQMSKEGDFLSVLYRVGNCRKGVVTDRRPGSPPFHTYLLMYSLRNGQLWRVPRVVGSHQDWGWGSTLLVADSSGYYHARWRQPVVKLGVPNVGVERLGDGHASHPPDAGLRYVLSDTRAKDGVQSLFLWDLLMHSAVVLGRFAKQNEAPGAEFKVDLHPRWDRFGAHVAFDSTSEGSRQVYIAKTGLRLAVQDPNRLYTPKPEPRRHVVVMGAGDITTTARLLRDRPDGEYTRVHVFEPNMNARGRLSRAVAAMASSQRLGRLDISPALAWTSDGTTALCSSSPAPSSSSSASLSVGRGGGKGAAAAGSSGEGAAARASRAMRSSGRAEAGAGGAGARLLRGIGAHDGATARGSAGGAFRARTSNLGGRGIKSGVRAAAKARRTLDANATAGGVSGGVPAAFANAPSASASRGVVGGGGGMLWVVPSGRSIKSCPPGATSFDAKAKTVDVSAWLRKELSYEEHVECRLAGGSAIAEAVLSKLIADGTAALCDRMHVQWGAAAAGGEGRGSEAAVSAERQRRIVRLLQKLGVAVTHSKGTAALSRHHKAA